MINYKSFGVSMCMCTFGLLCTVGAGRARSAIMVEADRAYPAGAHVFTINPELTPNPAARNLAADRMLRQTFQLAETIQVEELVLSLGVAPESVNGGIDVSIFRVADVNAETFAPLGLVHTFSIPTTDALPATTEDRTGFLFSDADVFTLGARNSGVEGYAIEISNGDDATNVGPWRHTNTDGVDHYEFGKFYTESGGQSGPGTRDVGLALGGTVIPEPSTVALACLAFVGLAAIRRERR